MRELPTKLHKNASKNKEYIGEKSLDYQMLLVYSIYGKK